LAGLTPGTQVPQSGDDLLSS